MYTRLRQCENFSVCMRALEGSLRREKRALSVFKHSCGCIVIFPIVALMENSCSHIFTFHAHISHLIYLFLSHSFSLSALTQCHPLSSFLPFSTLFQAFRVGWIMCSLNRSFSSCEDIFRFFLRSSPRRMVFSRNFFSQRESSFMLSWVEIESYRTS